MLIIQWDQSYSVGVQSLDKDHQKIFSLINELHEAMKSGKGKEASIKIVKELYDYTVYHFNREEEMLKKTNSPELDMQKKQHAEFISKIEELQTRFETGRNISVSIELNKFLKDWISEHIKGKDKRYSETLKKEFE